MKDKETERSEIVLRRILHGRREVLIEYLTMKTDEQDWHAVADAAMDLRELDARLEALNGDD